MKTEDMKSFSRRTFLSCALTLLLLEPIYSQATFGQRPIVFEFVGIMCAAQCDRLSIKIYSDGNYVAEDLLHEKSKSGRVRSVMMKAEKQLEPSELEELVSWAEQPEFLNAQEEYVKQVIDQPSHITIYFSKNSVKKKVMVANYEVMTAEQKAKIPVPLMKLIRWAYPYSFE